MWWLAHTYRPGEVSAVLPSEQVNTQTLVTTTGKVDVA